MHHVHFFSLLRHILWAQPKLVLGGKRRAIRRHQ